jgi:coenzyme PQQ precursor peptide PqqA
MSFRHLSLIDKLRPLTNTRTGVNVTCGGNIMAWSKPIIREIECGMEINMYGPDGDRESEDGDLF